MILTGFGFAVWLLVQNNWLVAESPAAYELPSSGGEVSHGTYLSQDLINLNDAMLKEALFYCIPEEPLDVEEANKC